MKKILLSLVVLISMSSCATIQGLITEPSTFETISALRQVLNSSAFKTLDKLAKVNDQGLEGALPEELKPVLATLRTLGMGDDIDKASKSIGKASGVVLGESKGIISDAIKEIRFDDAVSIVLGGEDAASVLMKNAMYGAVKARYSERLETELAKGDANKYWPMAQSAYNMFSKNKIQGSLSDFLAERAVDALFIGMGKEEAVIRKNPESLGSSVVNKVFDYYKNNKPS